MKTATSLACLSFLLFASACSSAGTGATAQDGGGAGAAGSPTGGGSGGTAGAFGGAAGGPAGGAAGSAGSGGGGFVPSTSDDVWLAGEIDTSDTIEIARLDLPSKSKTKLPISAVEALVDPSRDGKTLAIATRDASGKLSVALYGPSGDKKLELYSYPNKVVSQYSSAFRDLALSADGERVAFSVSADGAGYTYDLYVAPTDGSSPAKKVSTGIDVAGFHFDRKGTHLTYWDFDTLMSLDLSTSVSVELGAGKLWQERTSVGFDSKDRVYFLSGSPTRLHRVAAGGSPEPIAASALTKQDGTDADVTSFALSPSGDELAFAGAGRLSVMAVDASTANAYFAPGTDGSFGGRIVWSPKGGAIAAQAGYKLGTTTCNSIVYLDLSAGTSTRLLDVAWNKGGASSFAFSTDGSRLFFRSEMASYGHPDVYSTSAFGTKDQDYGALVVEGVPLKADVDVVPAY